MFTEGACEVCGGSIGVGRSNGSVEVEWRCVEGAWEVCRGSVEGV